MNTDPPRQSGELDHNDMIMLHYLNSSDIVNAISYALMLKGLGISDDERHKLALDIATSNTGLDLTPEGIRKVVDDATKDISDDNIDYDNVADMQLDEYIAEHELKYPDENDEDTDVSGLAKSITQQDLGRTFDSEEE